MGGPTRVVEVDPLVEDLRMDRHARGLSQTWVAEQVGTVQSAISQIESGVTNPTVATLRRWASAQGYDLVLVKREDE